MNHPLHSLLVATALAFPAAAQTQAAEPTVSSFSDREQAIAAFERLPQASLQALFLRCDRESREQLLPLADAVKCAMAWDALLRRGFDNDVGALLGWWSQHKDAAATASTAPAGTAHR